MAKCTDCLCYDACKTIFELAFKQTLPEQPFDKAENCKNFKDKSKFVEVVRCKDCKHFVRGEPYEPCECMKWIARFAVAYTEPHGYCHKAERKDNG